MKLLKPSIQAALAALALSLAACSRDLLFEGNGYSNPRRVHQIKDLYAARDACLAKNAVPSDGRNSDAASIAKAVALSCAPETARLIAATNVDNDPKIADAIRKDTDTRALHYVLQVRGERWT